MRAEIQLVLWAALGGVVLAPGCAESPIVGLDCRADRAFCDGACVDLQTDPANCGSCGDACGAAQTCAAGECVSDDDGPDVCDGRTDCDGQCVDAQSDPSHCGACGLACADGEACERGECVSACGAPLVDCDDACVDTDRDDAHCGACGNRCAPATRCEVGACVDEPDPCPVGSDDCSGVCVDVDTDPSHCGACGIVCAEGDYCSEGACTPECAEGLVACGRSCVDLAFDADNCGACGNRCDTGLCEAGVCQRGDIGHWVLVGHDYGHGRTDQNRIVGNSVFLARGAVVDVVVYSEGSDAAEVENVYAALDEVAAETGRSWEVGVYEDGRLADALVDRDVLLVVDQEGSTGDEIEALGAEWVEDLDRFLRRGGVVVVTDGSETHRVLVGAGLADIASATPVSGERVDVVGGADAVAGGMPRSYRAEETSLAFETELPAVVSAGAGPVVLHIAVAP